MTEELFPLKHQLNGSINTKRKMSSFLAPAISTSLTVQFARIHMISLEIKDLLTIFLFYFYCCSFSSVGTVKDTAWTVRTVNDIDWPVWPTGKALGW